MNVPNPENQTFTDSTLKGFLLKNVDNSNTDPAVVELNKYLVQRVDTFWDQVVVPLRKAGNFNGNKINWYYEVYKEGVEARRVRDNQFTFITIDTEKIQEIMKFFQNKTVVQYCELGTSFLSNCHMVLSSWYRDQLVMFRLEKIYSSEDPLDWILTAEKEERGAMSQKPVIIEGLESVINNITLLMSRRA